MIESDFRHLAELAVVNQPGTPDLLSHVLDKARRRRRVRRTASAVLIAVVAVIASATGITLTRGIPPAAPPAASSPGPVGSCDGTEIALLKNGETTNVPVQGLSVTMRVGDSLALVAAGPCAANVVYAVHGLVLSATSQAPQKDGGLVLRAFRTGKEVLAPYVSLCPIDGTSCERVRSSLPNITIQVG